MDFSGGREGFGEYVHQIVTDLSLAGAIKDRRGNDYVPPMGGISDKTLENFINRFFDTASDQLAIGDPSGKRAQRNPVSDRTLQYVHAFLYGRKPAVVSAWTSSSAPASHSFQIGHTEASQAHNPLNFMPKAIGLTGGFGPPEEATFSTSHFDAFGPKPLTFTELVDILVWRDGAGNMDFSRSPFAPIMLILFVESLRNAEVRAYIVNRRDFSYLWSVYLVNGVTIEDAASIDIPILVSEAVTTEFSSARFVSTAKERGAPSLSVSHRGARTVFRNLREDKIHGTEALFEIDDIATTAAACAGEATALKLAPRGKLTIPYASGKVVEYEGITIPLSAEEVEIIELLVNILKL